jgi:hypothetical protein
MEYRKQIGETFMTRLIGAARDSETILWGQFCILVACVAGQLDNVADLLGVPEMKDFINSWVGNPQVISLIMLIIASVSIKARLRKDSSDPVTKDYSDSGKDSGKK